MGSRIGMWNAKKWPKRKEVKPKVNYKKEASNRGLRETGIRNGN